MNESSSGATVMAPFGSYSLLNSQQFQWFPIATHSNSDHYHYHVHKLCREKKKEDACVARLFSFVVHNHQSGPKPHFSVIPNSDGVCPVRNCFLSQLMKQETESDQELNQNRHLGKYCDIVKLSYLREVWNWRETISLD